MPVQLSIIEKSIGQTERQAFSLRLASQRVPAREIIAAHVRAEVLRLNDQAIENRQKHDRVASFLVGPHAHETERALNTARGGTPWLLEPEGEMKAVFDSIAARQIIMLFDGQEVEDLEADLTVSDDSTATFLRLMPLVGG